MAQAAIKTIKNGISSTTKDLTDISFFEMFNQNYKRSKIVESFESDVFGLEKMKRLDFFLTIGFDNDSTIKPLNSTIFGTKILKNKKLGCFKNTKYYKTNMLGLKDMYNEGKFAVCLAKGFHNDYNSKNLLDLL